MILRKIKDEIKDGKVFLYHSTKSLQDLGDILLKGMWKAGGAGGSMLGDGFYGNFNLSQAQKHNYGPYILKVQLYGIKEFLILDLDPYNKVYKPAATVLDKEAMIQAQLVEKFPQTKWSEMMKVVRRFLRGESKDIAFALWKKYSTDLLRKFNGFVYTGRFDRESVVCWYPNELVKPLVWTKDDGKTWLKVTDINQYLDIAKLAPQVKVRQAIINLLQADETDAIKKAVEAAFRQLSNKEVMTFREQLTELLAEYQEAVKSVDGIQVDKNVGQLNIADLKRIVSSYNRHVRSMNDAADPYPSGAKFKVVRERQDYIEDFVFEALMHKIKIPSMQLELIKSGLKPRTRSNVGFKNPSKVDLSEWDSSDGFNIPVG